MKNEGSLESLHQMGVKLQPADSELPNPKFARDGTSHLFFGLR